LAVRRPHGRLVEAGAAQRVGLRLALAVGRADVEPVLAALVGEVGDRVAVGRPGGGAVVGAGRVGEVARVGLLGGPGGEVAAGAGRPPAARTATGPRGGRTSPP